MHALETQFSKIYLQFQIVSNTIRMHALETLFSNLSLKFQSSISTSVRMYQFTVHVFKMVYVVPTRSKQYQNACFRDLVFKIVSEFQIVSEYMLQKPCFLKFQIVSNRFRMHAFQTLLLKFSLKLQIVPNSVRIHALSCFRLVSEVPHQHFKQRQNVPFYLPCCQKYQLRPTHYLRPPTRNPYRPCDRTQSFSM